MNHHLYLFALQGQVRLLNSDHTSVLLNTILVLDIFIPFFFELHKNMVTLLIITLLFAHVFLHSLLISQFWHLRPFSGIIFLCLKSILQNLSFCEGLPMPNLSGFYMMEISSSFIKDIFAYNTFLVGYLFFLTNGNITPQFGSTTAVEGHAVIKLAFLWKAFLGRQGLKFNIFCLQYSKVWCVQMWISYESLQPVVSSISFWNIFSHYPFKYCHCLFLNFSFQNSNCLNIYQVLSLGFSSLFLSVPQFM